MKKAIIFGITGQDGSYLAELLLKKKYKVYGVKRRSSVQNTERIDHIYEYYPNENKKNFYTIFGDVLDAIAVNRIITKIKPDEIYNLAAQSHVAISFELPEYTSDVNALGTLRILEAIKNQKNKIRYYQAGTSEMYGGKSKGKLSEKSAFIPQSPYAAAKIYSHWITKIYRDAYGIHASNGILFNHESPRRGENFVTRKICKSLCEIKYNKKKILYLGNLYSKRDWGHAREYVEAMWRITQHKKPDDYVISTSKKYSVKQFVNMVCKYLNIKIKWVGKGLNEKAIDTKTNKIIIKVDKIFFRPLEVNNLQGDYTKAKKVLKWKPKIHIKELIKEIVSNEINRLQK